MKQTPWGKVALCSLLASSEAGAFDYSEHEYISRMGVTALVDSPGKGLTPVEALQDLAVLQMALGPNYCALPDRQSLVTPTANCFLPSDIPAMSGDHAASPMLLKWRFFDKPPTEEVTKLQRTWDFVVLLSKGFQRCTPPEYALSKTPAKAADFLRSARSHSLYDHHDAGPPSDGIFSGVDPSYYTLASNGCTHFRNVQELRGAPGRGMAAVRRDISEERHGGIRLKGDKPDMWRYKPALNAIAWYADLHAGALAFAYASHGLPPLQHDQMLAMALLFELSSLHQLEDSVAAGHTITDALNVPNLGKLASHNRSNQEGLSEVFPIEACPVLRSLGPFAADLTVLCEREKNRSFMVYGDHVLFSPDAEKGKLSSHIASAAVFASVRTVLQAAHSDDTNRSSENLSRCLEAEVPQEDGAWLKGIDKEDKNYWVYRCGHEWWEVKSQDPHFKSNAIEEAWRRGEMDALLILPVPEEGAAAIRSKLQANVDISSGIDSAWPGTEAGNRARVNLEMGPSFFFSPLGPIAFSMRGRISTPIGHEHTAQTFIGGIALARIVAPEVGVGFGPHVYVGTPIVGDKKVQWGVGGSVGYHIYYGKSAIGSLETRFEGARNQGFRAGLNFTMSVGL